MYQDIASWIVSQDHPYAKLKGNSDQRIQLYTLANSIDPNITHLLHQQEGLEKDLNAGEMIIVKDRKIWDDLW